MKKDLRMRHALSWAIAASAVSAAPALACGPESYMGTVCSFATSYCPSGWVQADGRLLQVNTNQALYSLLGTTFGGDGRTTFGIPDLRARSVVGTGQNPAFKPVTSGQQLGQQEVTLQPAQTPVQPHMHPAVFTGTGGGGQQSVTIPAVASTLEVQATLSARKLPGVVSPDKGFLLGQGGSGSNAAPIYVNPINTGTDVMLGGLGATLSGSPGNPAITFNVPTGITGGTVAVQSNLPVAATMPVSTQSPGLGLTTCILVNGLYPPRP